MDGSVEFSAAPPCPPVAHATTAQQSIAASAESDDAAWKLFLFNWRLLAGAIGIVVAGLVSTEFHINPAGYLITFAIAAVFWRFGHRSIRLVKSSNIQVSYCLVAMAQILVAVSILTTLTYLTTSLGLPSWDTTLLAWDRALGLDFRSYLHFFNEHPRLLTIL